MVDCSMETLVTVAMYTSQLVARDFVWSRKKTVYLR